MNPKSTRSDELYDQDTDLQIISLLSSKLKSRNFLDVGAEKGGFANALFGMGFEHGVLFEPLPSHLEHLTDRFKESPAVILAYAIDREDRTATFNIACDVEGIELNYFHSLNKIADHNFFKHSRSIVTQCRSLESLAASGEIEPEIGVLKIDTEGNDLRVLQGIGALRPEVVVCEFVPPFVYPEWKLSFAENLIPEAAKLGYTRVVAIQRTHGEDIERVRLDPKDFTPKDWGNLVFVREDLFESAETELRFLIRRRNETFALQSEVPVIHESQYGAGVREWLRSQLQGFSRTYERAVALDVGAHKGEFFRPFLGTPLISSAVLFEPHPSNAEQLRKDFVGLPVTIEELAVSSSSGTSEFRYGEDTATGSLLNPSGTSALATELKQVNVCSLDDYAEKSGILECVNVLKIDTQGSDLHVLEGAARLLAESQPILIVELIFAPLYDNQNLPEDLIIWLAKRNYRLAGFFDEHFSREGWLAWCDACFLPVARMTAYHEPYKIRQSSPALNTSRKTKGNRSSKRRKSFVQKLIGKFITPYS